MALVRYSGISNRTHLAALGMHAQGDRVSGNFTHFSYSSIVLSIRTFTLLFYLQVVAGVRSLMYQRDVLHKRLELAESMRAFISHRMSHVEELRARLEQVEDELAALQNTVVEGAEALKKVEEEKEAFRMKVERLQKESEEAKRLRKEKESVEAKF